MHVFTGHFVDRGKVSMRNETARALGKERIMIVVKVPATTRVSCMLWRHGSEFFRAGQVLYLGSGEYCTQAVGGDDDRRA